MSALIYMLTFADGQRYIGQTVDLKNRLRRHASAAKQGADVMVSQAWASMGDPECKVLCHADPETMDELERHYIALHGTLFPAGLNRETGGNAGQDVCEATRERHRLANAQRYAKAEERERARQQMLVRYTDPAERKKSSATQLARYKDQAARDKTSAAMKAVGARPQEQARKSEASRRLWADPTYRAHLLAAKQTVTPRGDACSWAKVTAEAVREIREQRQAGVPIEQVAQAYGISIGSVSGIANRKTWKHIP